MPNTDRSIEWPTRKIDASVIPESLKHIDKIVITLIGRLVRKLSMRVALLNFDNNNFALSILARLSVNRRILCERDLLVECPLY